MRENMSKEFYQETAAAFEELDHLIKAAGRNLLARPGMSEDARQELAEYLEQLEYLTVTQQVKAQDEAELLERIEQDEQEELEYLMQIAGGKIA